MKLDPDLIHYLTKEHFRVLTAVEMGMKNHEYVPLPLIESLAALKRSNTYKVVQFLLKHKLVMHVNKQYDGYALTYGGYDYLALKAFMKRGHIKQVTIKIGVGKESDIYMCENPEGEMVVIKFARLGRTSFRTVKENRDYLKGRTNHSWLYLSRIASLKEFAFMKALYNKGFPTPVPIDSNRHAIVMSHIKGYPMANIKELGNAKKVYEALLEQIIKLAEHGLVHGDFNEFNLLINDDE
jgi:RIO kinase 2